MNDHEWLLSISIAQHDASITLLHHDDEIVLYINEERTSRDKHDSGLPLTCLSKITDYTNILDKILLCNIDKKNGEIKYYLMKVGIKLRSGDWKWTSDIKDFNTVNDDFHHNHHASCGFYFSPFDGYMFSYGWMGV